MATANEVNAWAATVVADLERGTTVSLSTHAGAAAKLQAGIRPGHEFGPQALQHIQNRSTQLAAFSRRHIQPSPNREVLYPFSGVDRPASSRTRLLIT
eukprot:2085805-Prymnesium_polylepis.1